MLTRCFAVVLALSALSFATGQDAKYSVKPATTAAPKELAADVQKLFGEQSVQLLDAAGKSIGEFWFRPAVVADATPEQIKNGITCGEVPQTSIIGAVRFDQDWTDYRKQKVKAGVYTLRLGYQPSDGDHQGSSEFQEFLLVCSSAKDKSTELLGFKEMVELSGTSIGATHPAVFMLAPNPKAAGPNVVAMPKNHWVLQTKSDITVGGKKAGAKMGIGLNVVGHAD